MHGVSRVLNSTTDVTAIITSSRVTDYTVATDWTTGISRVLNSTTSVPELESIMAGVGISGTSVKFLVPTRCPH
jgi:hypothetical protein